MKTNKKTCDVAAGLVGIERIVCLFALIARSRYMYIEITLKKNSCASE